LMDTNYRQYIVSLIVTVVLGLLTMAGFNIIFDTNHIFASSFFYRKALKQIQIDFPLANLNYHLLNKERIIKSSLPESIIIGKSRTMSVHGEAIAQKNFANHWIPNLIFKDMLGLLGCYRYYHHQYPRRIILSLDPTAFDLDPKEDTETLDLFDRFVLTQNER